MTYAATWILNQDGFLSPTGRNLGDASFSVWQTPGTSTLSSHFYLFLHYLMPVLLLLCGLSLSQVLPHAADIRDRLRRSHLTQTEYLGVAFPWDRLN